MLNYLYNSRIIAIYIIRYNERMITRNIKTALICEFFSRRLNTSNI